MTTSRATDGLAGGQRRGLPDAEPSGAGMRRAQLVLLGWRMSVATPDGRRRLLLAGLGTALAMFVLVAGLGVLTARSAQQQRVDDRAPTSVDQRPDAGLAVVPATTGYGTTTWYRGMPVEVVTAVPIGTPPPPPGLDAFPQPGQIAASPAFAALHAADPLFAARYPGEITATIREQGLAGPNELYAWVAVADAAGTFDTTGYGKPEWQAQADAGDRETADLVIPLGVLLFVLPVLILVGTSTRLGSGQRDRRMAAMRLVGATPGEVRLVSAAEAGAIAAVGVAGGLLLFALVRPLVALLPWRPGIFSADLAPSPALVVLIGVALPLLGVLAGYASQRRVVTSPLGVTRRATPRPPRPWRAIPLAVGLAMLLVLLLFPQLINGPVAIVYLLLLGGAGLTLLGLVLATPLVGARASTALLRWPPLPLAGQLGARRVQADPMSAGRLVTGITVLTFIATWILAAFMPVLGQANTGYVAEQQAQVTPGTVAGLSRLDTVPALQATAGVRTVVPILVGEPTQTDEEDDDWTGRPSIGDCAALAAVLRAPLPQCGPDTAYQIYAEPTTAPIRLVDPIDGRTLDVADIRFAQVALPDSQVRTSLSELGLGDYLLPGSNLPTALPEDWPVQMLVATDGDPSTIEAVKTTMAASTGQVPFTAEDQQREGSTDQRLYTLLLVAYLAAIALIAVVSLAITAADDVRNRARAIASLAAAGTPTSTLRRASLVQLLLTLLPAVALALAAAAIAAFMYSQLSLVDSSPGTPRPFEPGVIAVVGAGSVLIVLAAYALTLPTLRNAVDLRGLRTT
jgi:hypothetical protein